MPIHTSSTLTGKGLTYSCFIGFHTGELGAPQEITVDFEATLPIRSYKSDSIDDIVLDYYKANELIADLIAGKRFNLIEAVAHRIADLLLGAFPILGITVRVTKHPLDMPNVESVAYECHVTKTEQ